MTTAWANYKWQRTTDWLRTASRANDTHLVNGRDRGVDTVGLEWTRPCSCDYQLQHTSTDASTRTGPNAGTRGDNTIAHHNRVTHYLLRTELTIINNWIQPRQLLRDTATLSWPHSITVSLVQPHFLLANALAEHDSFHRDTIWSTTNHDTRER